MKKQARNDAVISRLKVLSITTEDSLTFWMYYSIPFQRMFLASMAPKKNLNTNYQWPTQKKIH
jgi:hypothetical protein